MTLSSIEREKRKASCGTQPTVARSVASGSVVTSRPPTNTVPGGGSQSRASSRPSVVFPAPVGPTTATMPPGATENVTPLSAALRPG